MGLGGAWVATFAVFRLIGELPAATQEVWRFFHPRVDLKSCAAMGAWRR
jgi:hypothetical protein